MLCSPRALAPFSGSSPTTSPDTRCAAADACPGNRACRHRSLIIALSAAQQAPPTAASSLPFTAGTPKTLRPAQLHQILATRLLSAKTPLKLLQRTRVVLHEPAYYMLGLRESSAYHEPAFLTTVTTIGVKGPVAMARGNSLCTSSGLQFVRQVGTINRAPTSNGGPLLHCRWPLVRNAD